MEDLDLSEVTNENTLADIHAEALERMESGSVEHSKKVDRITFELDFSSGNHWTDAEKVIRAGRPCLVVDKTQKYVDKVAGYFRQNPPGALVKPRYNASKDVATVLTGYTRSLLSSSSAKACIQTAGEHLTKVGFGYLYVSYEAEGPRAINEFVPKLVRIEDPRSVRIDPSSTESDGSDAEWAMLLRKVEKEKAETLYGEDVTSFSGLSSSGLEQWTDSNAIVLADYWWKEYIDDTLYACEDPATGEQFRLWSGEFDKKKKEIHGLKIKIQHNAKRAIVKYALVSGAKVIESKDWPGLHIPIVPAYGRQIWIDGVSTYSGMIGATIDAQKLVDYYVSTSAEVTALAPRVPYWMTPLQAEGHEQSIENSVVSNPVVLYFNPDPANPGQPQRNQQTTDISPLLNAVQAATADLADVTGIYEASLGQESTQKSGVAIENSAKNSDQVIAIMIDNLRRAVVRAMQIGIDMVPFLYDEARNITYMTDDGEEFSIPVNAGPQELDIPGLQGRSVNVDLTTGVFDVVVESGTSYQTRKQDAAQGGIELMSVLPDAQKVVIAPEVVKMQDWPGAKRMARALIASLPPEIQSVLNDEQTKEDPQAKAIMMQMQGEMEALNTEIEQNSAEKEALKNALQQLQMAILSTQGSDETKERIAIMDNMTRIEVAQINTGAQLEQTEVEIEAKQRMEILKMKQNDSKLLLDTALKNAQRFLGTPSMGPQGDTVGRIRGVVG
jgi:hypothetical protein